ncbi:aldehyde dehydrogenase family protein [Streptomyces sp. NPDC005953]|uniref:aldehyde dehydrogenase family protein n=1 Tax=Streptomyces sp. NPDC005953 TaxID=3156719 RepID=UPI00340E8D18
MAPGEPTPDVVQLDALAARGPYRGQLREPVIDVSGRLQAELALVPSLFAHRALGALRRASAPPPERRARALAEAGRRFAEDELAGLTPQEYTHRVCRVSGLPVTAVRSAVGALAHAAAYASHTVEYGRPRGVTARWADLRPDSVGAVWTRRGRTLVVNAPGNHPAVHANWLGALALGYRVAVRPSRREPFTPHRLVTALLASGFHEDEVMLLPTSHGVADELVREADLAIVYGGDDTVRRHRGDPRVLTQGPGRSKVLLGRDGVRAALDTVVDSVAHDGGTACVNATAVLVESDPEPVARAIAERLAELPPLLPQDERAVLPVYPVAVARALEKTFQGHARSARTILGQEGLVAELGDGSAALRPSVVLVDRPDSPLLGVELPYPCVWVAPWSASDGTAPLRDTLVLTAVGCSDGLLEQLADEPTIATLHTGHHPTRSQSPDVPHDGYLTDFLMRAKGVRRG